jgi:two-component system, NtrC family, response regulator GlrR
MRPGKAILCISNDPVPLNFRCTLLKTHGWNVLSAGSGHEGVRRFAREDVDAVVIDLDHDGAEAALITGELKRKRPKVPVILLVASDTTLVPGATKQADAVIAKSEESASLVKVLSELLKDHQR